MVTARPRLAVVVPVYGNEASLVELYERVVSVSDKANVELTIQFVNDRSPDNSQAVLEELAERDPRVRVILLSRNHGSFVAIAAGLAQVAGHDAAVILSADLQDPPETIPQMVDLWRAGKRVVLCARGKRDDPLATRLFAEVFHWLFRRIALKEMPPGGFDFCLIDRAVIRVVLESGEKKTSLVGLILWAGFDRAVIEYERAPRKHGKSMWSLGRKISYAFHSIVAFSSFPMKFFGVIGLSLGVACLFGICYVVLGSLLGGIAAPGWASVILTQLITITVLFLGFGIFGSYLWINLEQTRKRPLFIIDKRIGFGSSNKPNSGDVPLFDINEVTAEAKSDLWAAMKRVIGSPQVILGPEVAHFESEFAAWTGIRHCVGVANGTDAITLALWASGVKHGEKVIVPALTAPPTVVAVMRAGCIPVFADVDPATLTLDPDDMERAARDGAAAVVPVHLYGIPCDMASICTRAHSLGLVVVEDCAQSAGSVCSGSPCGSFGAASAFSFYPTKNLGCYGDGGAVLTDDAGIAETLRSMRFYGQNVKGECVTQGINSRLDEMQASLLSVRLRYLDQHNRARVRIAAFYDEALPFLNPVSSSPGRAPHLYVIRPKNREGFREHMIRRGIMTGVHYPIALTQHQYFRRTLGNVRVCPVAESAVSHVTSLPCYPGLDYLVLKRIVEACREWHN